MSGQDESRQRKPVQSGHLSPSDRLQSIYAPRIISALKAFQLFVPTLGLRFGFDSNLAHPQPLFSVSLLKLLWRITLT
jgi:hypothetical protein